jgi:hypothetical protein
MGNNFYKVSSLGSSISYSSYRYYNYATDAPLQDEKVVSIEERCTNLDSYFNFQVGKHSFLVLTTQSGHKIRTDYYENSPDTKVTYNYYDLFSSECFRYSKIDKPLTVSQAIGIIKKHTNKDEYSLLYHNCQHVARDAYNEITGANTNLLRNDYLNWYTKYMEKSTRNKIVVKGTDYIKNYDSVNTVKNDSNTDKKLTDEITEYFDNNTFVNFIIKLTGITKQQIFDMVKVINRLDPRETGQDTKDLKKYDNK